MQATSAQQNLVPAVISQAQVGNKMVGMPLPHNSASAAERADSSTEKTIGGGEA